MPKKSGIYYNKTNTCDNIKEDGVKCEEKLRPHNAYREYNGEGYWIGRWLCKNCYNKEQSMKPNSRNNILKSIANFRNKQLDKKSESGKGFIGEQIFCKTRNALNCNLKLDNFRSKIDVVDDEYGKVQVKSPSLSKYGFWKANYIGGDFETLVILCMSNNFEHVDRVYIIPKKEVGDRKSITITKDPSRLVWYKEFRVDNIPYEDAYRSMSIENCPILRN